MNLGIVNEKKLPCINYCYQGVLIVDCYVESYVYIEVMQGKVVVPTSDKLPLQNRQSQSTQVKITKNENKCM